MCFSIEVDQNIERLAKKYGAKISTPAFENLKKLQQKDAKKYQSQRQVFTKYWCPLITMEGNHQVIKPMRYQLLPSFCEQERYTRTNPKTGREQEIKNTFNARLDSLEKRAAWREIFMKQHAVVILSSFYEWVEHGGQKKMINFYQEDKQDIPVPCLYDTWLGRDDTIIQSFAVITTEPRAEVLKKGHDRSPLHLKEENIESWLTPETRNKQYIYKILKDQNKAKPYQASWV
jgi:putative SOS response-associated peptidase YedK